MKTRRRNIRRKSGGSMMFPAIPKWRKTQALNPMSFVSSTTNPLRKTPNVEDIDIDEEVKDIYPTRDEIVVPKIQGIFSKKPKNTLLEYQVQIKTATNEYLEEFKQKQGMSYNDYFSDTFIKNQNTKYLELVKEFHKFGSEATRVPDLKHVIDYLKSGLTIKVINEACLSSRYLSELRDSLIMTVSSVYINPERQFCYGPTLRVIKLMIEFYDIFIRSIRPGTPSHYHKYRYERMFEYCISMSTQGLIMIPTFYSLGVTDLLKLRPYPLFPIGIVMDLIHVDEFLQTPVEFFIHDINHIRRMFEENLRDMKSKGIFYVKDTEGDRMNDDGKFTNAISKKENDKDVPLNIINGEYFENTLKYYKRSFDFKNKIMGIINNNLGKYDNLNAAELAKLNSELKAGKITNKTLKEGNSIIIETRPFIETLKDGSIEVKDKQMAHLVMDDYSDIDFYTPIDHGYAHLIKILIFEITHEDALPMMSDVICRVIDRLSGIPTLFPRVTKKDNGTVSTEMRIEYGGSILGFVRYKIRYGFFDTAKNPQETYVRYAYRTDTQITIATQIALQKLCGKKLDKGLIQYCITDFAGLNKPVNPDNVKIYMKGYLNGTNGDLPGNIDETDKDNEKGKLPSTINEKGTVAYIRYHKMKEISERLNDFLKGLTNPVDIADFKNYINQIENNLENGFNPYTGTRPQPVSTNIGTASKKEEVVNTNTAIVKLLKMLK